ncbi:MAG: hypothetical protein GAK45_01681 [Pseudomonas citronellolis]|nr:MAG: hypothetical protein GAK45_01681 [Pseudomonas citronellolis]
MASTSGIDSATTMPVRRPSEKKLTSSTITSASTSTRTNSPTPSRTAAGWSETLRSSMPAGRFSCRWWNCASSALPSTRISPPSFIDTARPMASSPMKRMRGAGGSLKPRCTSATSSIRKVRSPTRMGKRRMSSTESKRPETRNCTRSLAVSKKPVALTAFCSSRAFCTADSGKPRVASLVFDRSIQIFSSCTPISSILPTSLTRCSCNCKRSA